MSGRGRAGAGARAAGARARVETLVIIDAAALRRGTTEGDELCEIEGIGPVSVLAATELLTEGGLRYLVKEGFDIKTVTKASRDIARSIEMALIVRDRTCARPGCGKRLGLEIDHREVDYRADGPTELDNLVRLCPDCHALKTFGGWRLEGKPGRLEVARAGPSEERAVHHESSQTCGRQSERPAHGGQGLTARPRRALARCRPGRQRVGETPA